MSAWFQLEKVTKLIPAPIAARRVHKIRNSSKNRKIYISIGILAYFYQNIDTLACQHDFSWKKWWDKFQPQLQPRRVRKVRNSSKNIKIYISMHILAYFYQNIDNLACQHDFSWKKWWNELQPQFQLRRARKVRNLRKNRIIYISIGILAYFY